MIFVPLLHYFKCKNLYSGNEAGMRYLLTPTKRTVPAPEGLVFDTESELLWQVAAGQIGVDMANMADYSDRA